MTPTERYGLIDPREIKMKVVEVFTDNFGVEDGGKLLISGFRTWGDAYDWIIRNYKGQPHALP